jgi:hypothetical protein
VEGVYEYWEKDGKYRIHVGIDLAEIPVSEIAYDGRQYQLALAHASTLSIAPADERDVPSEIPNPLFLVLRPLSVATPDCLLCEPRLSDLQTLRALRHAAGKSFPESLDTAGFSAKVTLSPSGNLATSVLSKKEVGLVEQADFSEYQALESMDMELPRMVKFVRTVSTESSAVAVAILYQIDELEIDRPIEDSVFTLDRSPYASIWQGDRFIKSPPCPRRRPAQER